MWCVCVTGQERGERWCVVLPTPPAHPSPVPPVHHSHHHHQCVVVGRGMLHRQMGREGKGREGGGGGGVGWDRENRQRQRHKGQRVGQRVKGCGGGKRPHAAAWWQGGM